MHQLGQHRLPIGDGAAHVGQHRLDPRLHLVHARAARRLGDAELHHRFGRRIGFPDREQLSGRVTLDPHDRVDHQMHRHVLAIELRGHGVDQERHVVVDDVDDRVPALPAVLLDLGIEDPDLRRAGRALLREVEEREGRREQVLRRLVRDVVRRHIGIEGADEILDRFLARSLDTLTDEVQDVVDEFRLQVFGSHDRLARDCLCGGWEAGTAASRISREFRHDHGKD
jgi:hypothetical protein